MSALINHIKNIRTSGTILPSSRFLVHRLLEGVDFTTARTIVEFGVGTGCVTREILRRMRPDARLVSLEINPVFAEEHRELGDPRFTLVEACATELPRILRDMALVDLDAVVSSLPLSLMEDEVVERILDGVRESLGPDGTFNQYQYSLSGHARLTRRYRDVGVTFTLVNIPPAFVYACRREDAPSSPSPRRLPSLGSLYAAGLAMVAVAVRAYQQL